MRYTCLLLSMISVCSLFAADIIYDDVEMNWPPDGNFQVILASEVILKTPCFIVTGKEEKILYRAPATYIPQKATMMNPMGGDELKGDKWTALKKGEILSINGGKSGIVMIKMNGKCTKNGFKSSWNVCCDADKKFTLTFILIAEDEWEKDLSNPKILSLKNNAAKLMVESNSAKIKVHAEKKQGMTCQLVIYGHGNASFKINIVLVEK